MVLIVNKEEVVHSFAVKRGTAAELGSLVAYLTDCGWQLVFRQHNDDGDPQPEGNLSPGEISDLLEPRG